ncbi:AAA family ATPase [Actinotalea sp. Marseille-Q4924]|uniref:cytidylate kinase-like family protein n=1 Tax=Actinotalea sp. Marseille-Q4924 TaxID=2866571 RepID=UPI001CE3C6E2|nr:cytidylate kinase-like family protein [Actinotalea sp. Marseille-Q4924]
MSDDPAATPSDRPVVTLFEHYGAGASAVGRAVAEELGLPFHAQAFTSDDLGAADDGSTAQNATLAQVYSALGGAYGGFEGRDVVATQQDKYDLVMTNNRSVWADAAEGGVIVGRNATVVLASRPRTVHVLLTGSVEDRVARAAEESGISVTEAARRQVREDEVRAQMSVVLYGWDPRLPDRYDVVVNTSRIPLHAVVQAIVQVVRAITPSAPAAPARRPQES